MSSDHQPLDLSGIRTYALNTRASKVSGTDSARPWQPGGSLAGFIDKLPGILAGRDLRAVIQAIVKARQDGRPVILGMGAHVIKVGLNPVVVDLMQRGIITGVALNGAGIIHDFELAFAGQTSEEVGDSLGDGTFGMARETCDFLCRAVQRTATSDLGLGRAVGQHIIDRKLPHADQSILAAGARLIIPVTVHVAIGTDIIHMHPQFDAALTGAASHRDFRLFAAQVAQLQGGVYLNVGSAVLMPEVFLKAISVARNLGHTVNQLTTVNMDFMRHYRPLTNVVGRPTADGGAGYNLVGHHEIMLPLLAAGVKEELEI